MLIKRGVLEPGHGPRSEYNTVRKEKHALRSEVIITKFSKKNLCSHVLQVTFDSKEPLTNLYIYAPDFPENLCSG